MGKLRTDAGLFLIAIPILFWAIFPIWHLFTLSISTQQQMLEGRLFPTEPTLRNYYLVFTQGHYYLSNFWLQMWNSFFIAVATGVITLLIATFAAFAISQLKTAGGRMIMNFALATYLIPPPSSPCPCTRPWASTAC